MAVDPRLIQIGLELAPTFVDLFKKLFKKANPDAPLPTDAEFIAAAEATFNAEHAKNIAILDSHPATPPLLEGGARPL